MVHARLHVICGNCGSIATSGEMTYHIVPKDEDSRERVVICCANCATLHTLNDNIPAE